MFKKFTLAAGFGAGYVLGAKAGTQRYEQIVTKAREFAGMPAVQNATATVQDTAGSLADKAKETVSDKVSSGGSSSDSSSSGGSSDLPSSGTGATTRSTGAAGAAPSVTAPSTGAAGTAPGVTAPKTGAAGAAPGVTTPSTRP